MTAQDHGLLVITSTGYIYAPRSDVKVFTSQDVLGRIDEHYREACCPCLPEPENLGYIRLGSEGVCVTFVSLYVQY